MKKKIALIILNVVVILALTLTLDYIKAAGSDPGTVQDPLVTKSYVDVQLVALKASLEGKTSTTTTTTTQAIDLATMTQYVDAQMKKVGTTSGQGFSVVELAPESIVTCGESTEFIVRVGETKAIGNEAGNGISDVTSGVDLTGGTTIPLNHLVIVPRADGRGIMVLTKAFIMIKGTYTITTP